MRLQILGSIQGLQDGRPLALGGKRQRMVLASLLVHADEVVSTDRLIDDVWGDEPPDTARKSLQAYVSRLRRLLGESTIEAVPPGYVLHIDPDQCDVLRFERLARDGRRLLATDPAAAALVLDEALGLWRGMPWGDLADEPALRPDVERLRELRLAALEDRIEASLALGQTGAVAGDLESLVAQHPLRERLSGLLMRVLYQTGRQAEALRVYQEIRRRLSEELGIDPSPELQDLENRILLQDPALGSVRPPAEPSQSTGRNPYKGLRPFAEKDAPDFFGREEAIADIAGRVAAGPFVAVVGPSGSGKSSLVSAGLIPALRAGAVPGSDGWLIATMMPGSHPFEALEAALLHGAPHPPPGLDRQRRGDNLDVLRMILRVAPDAGTHVLLVIDQFEELFTAVEHEAERATFIANLIEALEDPHSGLRLVVVLRADFFDRPLGYPELGSYVTEGQHSVLPITAPDLEVAAVRPAAGVGVHLEPELVADLVAEVAGEPGSLPLFQYALTELFEHRQTDTVTLAAYRSMGGLRGALSRRADEVFVGLDHGQQATARQILLRLITLGEGVEDTRRRAQRSELAVLEADATVVDTVLEKFGAARLITFDRDPTSNQPIVEVAHEALLREWPRLRQWIDDARGDLRLHRSLVAEVAEWQAAGRDPDYLLTGTRLALYEGWIAETSLALTPAEREFVAASRDRRDGAEAAERARLERERLLERRSLTRMRVIVAVLAVAALAAAALTGFALNRSREAERQADEARQARDAELIASRMIQARELTAAAVANRDRDPELALLLSLHAVDLADLTEQEVPAETVAALHWSLQAARVQYPIADGPTAVLDGPDGPQGIFLLDLPDLLALAREHVARDLTAEECEVYFDTTDCPLLRKTFTPSLAADSLASTPPDPDRPLAGTTVSIMGAVYGPEADALRAEMARFTERTGIRVDYDGLPELEQRIGPKIEAGIPPDLALLPQPAIVAWGATSYDGIHLDGYLDVDLLRRRQSPHLVSLATVGADGSWPSADGWLAGAATKLSVKSLIWYPVPEFEQAGYQIPATWEELEALTEQMVADGRTPWCHGEEADVADGWPGTDWIEDLVLHQAGPEAYDRWIGHEVPFDSPEVKTAWEMMAGLLLGEGRIYGGQAAAATTPWWAAQLPMFDDPPGCWLNHTPSFAPAFFPYGVVPGVDASFFPTPSIDPDYGSAVLGAGEFVTAITDRPEVRELVEFLVSADYGTEMTKHDPGWISANGDFPVAEYQLCTTTDPATRTCVPNDLTRSLAELVGAALADDAFRFDGSDLMPPDVNDAFWVAMVEFVGEGPGNLDELLARLDSVWAGLAPLGEAPDDPGPLG